MKYTGHVVEKKDEYNEQTDPTVRTTDFEVECAEDGQWRPVGEVTPGQTPVLPKCIGE